MHHTAPNNKRIAGIIGGSVLVTLLLTITGVIVLQKLPFSTLLFAETVATVVGLAVGIITIKDEVI